MYKSATNVPKLTKNHASALLVHVQNTYPILSVPNETGVPNVNTVSNVPKMTNNDLRVPKNHLVYQLV